MSRFSLQPLLEHSQHRLEEAERLMRTLKHREDEARKRLESLEGYRGEYQSRLAGGAQSGMDIQLLRDYHVFMMKLETAIKQQQIEVEQAHARWQSAYKGWLEENQKVKAYETLAERHRVSEGRRQDKREQREFDELAGRKRERG